MSDEDAEEAPFEDAPSDTPAEAPPEASPQLAPDEAPPPPTTKSDRPDDCTCAPDCECSVCAQYKAHLAGKQAGDGGGYCERGIQAYHPPGCDCLDCLCGTLEEEGGETNACPSREVCKIVNTCPGAHVPDCDCPECTCDPACLLAEGDHPPDCDCLSCLCDSRCHREEAGEGAVLMPGCDCEECKCCTCGKKEEHPFSVDCDCPDCSLVCQDTCPDQKVYEHFECKDCDCINCLTECEGECEDPRWHERMLERQAMGLCSKSQMDVGHLEDCDCIDCLTACGPGCKEEDEQLFCKGQTCDHPDYPNCLCTVKSAQVKQESPVCGHPDYPYCPCTKLFPADATCPCSNPPHESKKQHKKDCSCEVPKKKADRKREKKAENKAKKKPAGCNHPNYPHCPCDVIDMTKLPSCDCDNCGDACDNVCPKSTDYACDIICSYVETKASQKSLQQKFSREKSRSPSGKRSAKTRSSTECCDRPSTPQECCDKPSTLQGCCDGPPTPSKPKPSTPQGYYDRPSTPQECCDRPPTPSNAKSRSAAYHPASKESKPPCKCKFEVTDIKRLSKDALIVKWSQPDNVHIKGYYVTVNGKVNCKVHSPKRTTTVVHDAPPDAPIYIKIHAVVSSTAPEEEPAEAIYQD